MQNVEIDTNNLTPEATQAVISINKALMAIMIDMVKTANRILKAPEDTPLIMRADPNMESYFMCIESGHTGEDGSPAFRISIIKKTENPLN